MMCQELTIAWNGGKRRNVNITMKQQYNNSSTGALLSMRSIINLCLWFMLLPIFAGCATEMGPVTIQHERTPSQSDVSSLSSNNSRANDSRREESDKTIAAMVELLKKKNLIDADEAALVTGQSETANNNAAMPADISAALEEMKKNIQEQVRSEVMNDLLREVWKINSAMTEKDKRLRFYGDIRLRYEKDRFDKNNADFAQPSNPSLLMNTKVDADRFKYRVRFGADAIVDKDVDAIIRLSTGSTSNPVSTNTTMGDSMNKDAVLFDLAYLKWLPWKFLTLYGGRMPNPWLSSDLAWAKDLNFEGLVLQARAPIVESWSTFLTTGAFPLQQYDFTQHGKWLMAGQLGVDRKSHKDTGVKIGVAYYNFKNITGVANDPNNPGATDWTAPQFQQKGNTLFNISADPNVYKTALASEFRELNVTGTLDIGFWDPFHVIILGDYVKNIGFKKDDVAARTGNPEPAKQVEGYQYGMSIGYPAAYAAGQWKAYFYKKRVGADAVVDGFTDSDFHLGGTNATGWILGTDIGVAKNTWLALRWITADQINGPPLAIDVMQVDFNARF